MTTKPSEYTKAGLPAPTHTPGPWTIVEVGPDEHLSVIHDCCESSADCEAEGGITEIADIYYQGGDGSMEPANARLISAAPELLTLAKIVAQWFHDATTSDEMRIHNDASAAIAKAKGE